MRFLAKESPHPNPNGSAISKDLHPAQKGDFDDLDWTNTPLLFCRFAGHTLAATGIFRPEPWGLLSAIFSTTHPTKHPIQSKSSFKTINDTLEEFDFFAECNDCIIGV